MLGSPNLVLSTVTFRPIDGNGGRYVNENSAYPFRNMVIVDQSIDKKATRRIKYERLIDLGANAATGDVASTYRMYLVIEAPKHTAVTSSFVRTDFTNFINIHVR